MDRLAAFIVRCYPRVWHRRYGDELLRLVGDQPVRWGTIWDLARAAAAAHIDRWSVLGDARKDEDMLRGGLLIGGAGAAFVLVSTLTRVDYSVWLVGNSVFGLLLMGTAFVQAMGSGRGTSWLRGFGAGVIGLGLFVAVLLGWVASARSWLVQLPFEHYDLASSGAASIDEYLAAGGWRDLWTSTALSSVVLLGVVALMAVAGVMTGRLKARLSREASA